MRSVRTSLQFIGIVGVLLLLFHFSPRVEASEGTFTLVNNDVVCKGISVWDMSEYKVLGRCQGLVYPFAEGYTTYVLWALPVDSDRAIRIGEIENGIIDGHSDKAFNQLFVSPENATAPDRPSGAEVLRGSLSDFQFSASVPTGEIRGVEILPSTTPQPSITPLLSQVRTRNTGFSLTGLLGSVSLVAIFIIIIIVIGILFIFWRSRSG